jgi:hypothetical protein
MRTSVFFVIFALTVFFLSIDSVIGFVSDFLVEENTSMFGISLFFSISGVFIVGSLMLFRFITKATSEIRVSSMRLKILQTTTLTTLIILIALHSFLLFQIILFSEYNVILLKVTAVVSPASAAAIMTISSLLLISWYRFNKSSYVVLIFAIAFSINVYTYAYKMTVSIYTLEEKDAVITPESDVVYSSDTYEAGSMRIILSDIYRFSSTASFVLLLGGSVLMLRHYSGKIGQARFWVLVLIPSLYAMSILLDRLGIYTPESESELFYYYIYSALSGVIGGILLGALFWNISRSMQPNRSVSSYLLLCSFGFILLPIAWVGQVSVASYPPFGFAAFSMLTLSSYTVILGLYSAAVSVSQDVRLRQYIKDLTRKDSNFLATIGQAELEKHVQSKVSDLENVVKEERSELEKKSGIQSSLQEQDIKQYLLEVLQEVDKHKH